MFRTFDKWMKMAAVAVCCLALAVLATQEANAQDPGESYNPYLIQGIVDETGASAGSTLIPAEFGGEGFVRFDVGNLGLDPLTIPPPGGNPNDVMTLVITLSKGVPNNVDPLAALSGPGVAWFDWTYDPGLRTYTAIQNQTIPGQSRENITIAYLVVENSFLSQSPTISNGFNVNLQPPGYTNPQPTDDDAVSSYTYVEALDYGDAPTTGTAPNGTDTNNYGSAVSKIDLGKDGNGFYNRYVYLGASVDPEDANQASDIANGDDANPTNNLDPSDDENGVTFPVMQPGTTVTIPVVVTIEDAFETFPTGILNAWIDWNGDGDWADPGEKIASAISVSESGTVDLTVAVPADAITTAPTYARFRFGNGASTTSSAPYGEVEDYQIKLGDPLAVTLSYAYAERDENGLVHFTWEMSTETDNAGFNLYMEVDDNLNLVNEEMIPSTVIDSIVPVRYTYEAKVDGEQYYIEAIDISEQTERHGPFVLGEEHGSSSFPPNPPPDGVELLNPLFLPLIANP